MAYRYKAIDMSGNTVEDTFRGTGTVTEATEELRRRGLFVVEINEIAAAAPATGGMLSKFGGGKRLKLVAGMLRQLSVLMASGTPLVQGLAAIERQTPDIRFRAVIRQLRESVEQGEPLGSAMKSQPAYFDAVCRGLVTAGEGSGNFNQILDRLANMLRQQCQIRTALTTAMIYPALLMAVSVGVVVLMIGFVLPRFEGMFDALGTDMPLPTKILLGVSTWTKSYWWVVLAAVAAATFTASKWAVTASGRSVLHGAAVNLPVLGKVVRAFCIARIARVLGLLLTSRIPLNEALKLSQEVAGNERFAAAVASAEETITRGGTLSGAFASSGLFTSAVSEAVHNGEQAGRLGELLTMVADYMDDENASVLKAATSLIEPVILIGVGLFVGAVVLSMFLPLFDVAASAGGGS